MVFLSVGLLFGFSSLSMNGLRQSDTVDTAWTLSHSQAVGTKFESRGYDFSWGRLQYPVIFRPSPLSISSSRKGIPQLARRQIFPLSLSLSAKLVIDPTSSQSIGKNATSKDNDENQNDGGEEGPDYQRIFGRASAWLCTTLYLTSRMPQLWKNVSHYS